MILYCFQKVRVAYQRMHEDVVSFVGDSLDLSCFGEQ